MGGAAAGAQRPVRARRQQHPVQVADRALAGVPPRPQRLIAARAAQHPAGQRDPGRRGVEDLDHRPSRQGSARPSRPHQGQLVLHPATPRRPPQPGTARSPGTGTWPTPGPAARAPDSRSLTPRIAHRHGAAADEPAWPVVAIGVPGAATASCHGNPERLSTPGTPGTSPTARQAPRVPDPRTAGTRVEEDAPAPSGAGASIFPARTGYPPPGPHRWSLPALSHRE